MREGILYVVRHGVPTVSLRCTPPCAAVDLKPTHSCLSLDYKCFVLDLKRICT